MIQTYKAIGIQKESVGEPSRVHWAEHAHHLKSDKYHCGQL